MAENELPWRPDDVAEVIEMTAIVAALQVRLLRAEHGAERPPVVQMPSAFMHCQMLLSSA